MTDQKKDEQFVEENLEDQESMPIEEQPQAAQDEQLSDAENAEAVSEEESNLQAQLKEEQERYEQLYERFLRLSAEYDNYRKRTMKEKEDAAKYAASSLLEKLLPVIDNFERALASAQQTNNVETLVQGLEMIHRQMMDALREEGAYPIEAIGKPFDPYYHQAVMQEPSDQYESGIVLEEFQKGYMLKDKVIRPSMVKVST